MRVEVLKSYNYQLGLVRARRAAIAKNYNKLMKVVFWRFLYSRDMTKGKEERDYLFRKACHGKAKVAELSIRIAELNALRRALNAKIKKEVGYGV